MSRMGHTFSITRRSLLLGCTATAAIHALGPLRALASDPSRVTLGTATPGGGFQLFGKSLIDAVKAANTGLTIEERATGGSGENLKLLRAGEIDFGQVEGNAAQRAFEEQLDSSEKLMVAAAMYPGPGMFVTRADKPFQTIADLKGKKVIYGTHSSGLTILVKSVLTGLGYDPDKDFEAVYLDKAGNGPPMLLSGEVDAYWGGGFGWPGFVRVSQGPEGARFIVPDAEGIAEIRERFPYLQEMQVPAGSYKGIEKDLVTVGLWSFILARPGLPDDMARRFADTLHKAGPGLSSALKQGSYMTPQNTARYAPPALLHPGVRGYLKEIGAL